MKGKSRKELKQKLRDRHSCRGILLTGLLPSPCSVSFYLQSRTTCPKVAVFTMDQPSQINHQSVKYATDLTTCQSGVGLFSFEVHSSQMILTIKLIFKKHHQCEIPSPKLRIDDLRNSHLCTPSSIQLGCHSQLRLNKVRPPCKPSLYHWTAKTGGSLHFRLECYSLMGTFFLFSPDIEREGRLKNWFVQIFLSKLRSLLGLLTRVWMTTEKHILTWKTLMKLPLLKSSHKPQRYATLKRLLYLTVVRLKNRRRPMSLLVYCWFYEPHEPSPSTGEHFN